MKKAILLAAVIAAVSFTQTAFAVKPKKPRVDNSVLASFEKDFILTSNVTWHRVKDVFVVDFKQLGVAYTAYYTEDGTLNSISTVIQKEMLPENITNRLNKKYNAARIINALKVRSLNDGISYVVELAERDNGQIVKIYEDGSIEKIKSVKA